MAQDRRLILLEFNELAPELMQRFIGQGLLPNFKRLFSESKTFITEAAERAPLLDPWIQWVTVHTGLNYDEHQIEHLNEGHTLDKPRIWDLLSEAGRRVWICGSMSIHYREPFNGAVLPDPWTTKVKPYPEALQPYFAFVQKNVLEYTNERLPLSSGDYANFAWFMLTHSRPVGTVAAVIKQLMAERQGKARWKRATLLDRLQFEVFRQHYRQHRPHLSTFFLNSTAHYQHLYWRNMEPGLFKVKPSDEEIRTYELAIQYGYQEMDVLIGEVLDMIAGEPDTTVVFATALSQQPCLVWEDQGGKSFYRPSDFKKFLTAVGLTNFRGVAPVMAHQFHIELESEDQARTAKAYLERLRIDGKPAMSVEQNGAQLFTGCQIYSKIPKTAAITVEGTNISVPFYDLFYQVEGMKSGMHHPDGLLWIRTPDLKHQAYDGKVALDRVCPTLVEWFGLPIPSHMKGAPLSLGAAATRELVGA
jgi:hypothetical protein